MKRLALPLPLLLAVALAALVACTGQPVPARAAAEAGAAAKAPQAPAAPPAPAPALARAKVEDPRAVYRVPLEDVPLRGPADALVTLVEVSDFECPFCRRAAPTLQRVLEAYPGQVRLAFRHNPLSMHPSAVPAALLAEEARVQGGDSAFWAAHDKLFALEALDAAALTRVAGELKLDESRLKASIAGRTYLERLRRDQNLVNGLGARSTPTFFINGRKLVGAQPFEAMKAVVDEELARAQALVKGGVKPRDVYAKAIERGATAPVLVDGPAAAPPAPPSPAAQAAAVALRADDAVKGPAAAPVTVAVFSDFQCPFCAKVEPTLRDLERDYPGKLRLAWRHQPLAFHPNALPAAKAAEAARQQGKFWEMHDKLFAAQAALSDATYATAAAELGLDAARFQRDLAAEATARRIAEDQTLAAKVGATGTPTAFVNCRMITGAQPLSAFKAVVDEELAAAEAARARGEAIDAGWYDRRCAVNVAAAPPPAAAPAPRTGLSVPLRPDDPARGPTGAKVTVVEFSDFQCPFCSRAVPAVKALEQAHTRDVRVVWKHLPLGFHPNARPAALAAEAARQQGKFWEMHDKLFAAQAALSDATYAKAAAELGLDLGRFKVAMASPETARRVDADAAAAGAAGVNGTPSFVVNGELVVGSSGLEAAVGRALEKARAAR